MPTGLAFLSNLSHQSPVTDNTRNESPLKLTKLTLNWFSLELCLSETKTEESSSEAITAYIYPPDLHWCINSHQMWPRPVLASATPSRSSPVHFPSPRPLSLWKPRLCWHILAHSQGTWGRLPGREGTPAWLTTKQLEIFWASVYSPITILCSAFSLMSLHSSC